MSNGALRAEPADPLDLSIVMPCLDEARSLGHCIGRARFFLENSGLRGEVLVSDNGSADGSPAIAERLGARLVHAPRRGYGEALRAGILAARGRLIVMGDADGSYDFAVLEPFIAALESGADLVIGNRFQGGIEPGAMPPLHRYFGNPLMSWMGRRMFAIPLGDFHCGLRGLRRAAYPRIDARAPGMEFASELIIRSRQAGLAIAEVPTTLSRDLRGRPPHLRSWRDGLRHLRLRLAYCPRWALVYPGLAALTGSLLPAPVSLRLGLAQTGALALAGAAALRSSWGRRGPPPSPSIATALAWLAGLMIGGGAGLVIYDRAMVGALIIDLGLIFGLAAWMVIALAIIRRPAENISDGG